jgi:hypothetical protein
MPEISLILALMASQPAQDDQGEEGRLTHEGRGRPGPPPPLGGVLNTLRWPCTRAILVFVDDTQSHAKDIAAQADAEEGIRQGLEDAEHGRLRAAKEFFEDFEAKQGIAG